MRLRPFLVIVIALVARLACSAEIELKNDSLSLRFDPQTGALSKAETADGIRLFGGEYAPVDICADGKWRFSERGAGNGPGVLCLDGQWDFRIEDGDWLKSHWLKLRVPGFWEEQGVVQPSKKDPDPNWKPYNGIAFYRTSFNAPTEWRGKAIKLVIYGVDDEDWTSLNGKEIGHTGMDVENWWTATRSYDVSLDLLRFDAPNVLDIKVYDRGGDGGIAGSVLIGPAERMTAPKPCALTLESHWGENKDGLKILTMNCSATDWQVQITYELPEKGSYFRRRAEWRYIGDTPTSVTCVRFNVPEACIDRPEDCVYTMPASWPPKEISLAALRDGRTTRAHGSEAVPAAAVLYNGERGLGLCTALYTEDEWTGVIIKEGQGSVDVYSEAYACGPIKKGDTIKLGDQVVYLSHGALLDSIGAVGKCWELAGFRLAKMPDWAYGAALYSLWAGGSVDSGCSDLGGLKNFRQYLLPRLHKLGFDAVWFNPINQGSYAPTRHRDVEPRLGTLDDLKDVCDDAHRRGMRIWLDLIPHGPREHSPDGENILKNHLDWVSREKDGSIKYWWGCLCCDYANPGWQAEMADVATFFVKRCGIDGWRVDCAAGSPPNEKPYDNLRPSQSGPYGALRLLRKVREEMTKADPDSAILGETGAATHLSQCDFVYDWCFQRTALYALADTPPDEWAPETKAWLERQQAALPDGAEFGLMRFLENHDQYRSMRRYGVGHERALLSVCSLIPGLVFVFSDQDIGFGPHIERLFRIRKSYEEFRRGRAIYTDTKSSAPSVFAFTRMLADKFSVVAVNFSSEDRKVDIQVPVDQVPVDDRNATYSATEVYDGEGMGEKPLSEWRALSLTAPPYGAKVVVFRRAGEPKPAIVKEKEEPKPTTRAPLKISQEGDLIAAENAFYRMTLSNGLVKSLGDCTGKQLLKSMNIAEGTRKIWPGARLDFANSVQAKGVVASEGGKRVVTFKGVMKRGAEVEIPWEARYTLDDSAEIGVRIVLHAPKFERPVRGQLNMEVEFGQADEWLVNTIEGRLHDYFSVTHPLGDMMSGGRYWHRSGLLWESNLVPLDDGQPIVGAKIGGTWLGVTLPPLLEGFENAYLRERSSAGRNGLTLCLAWLDEKGKRDLAAPIQAEFRLRVGSGPAGPTGGFSGQHWRFSSESSQYEFRNSHYDLTICRGLGGSISRFALPGGQAVVTAVEVYSDKGIYSTRKDSVGKDTPTTGSSKNDFEPDVFLARTNGGLDITLNSFLRLSYWSWANVASPRVQYEVSYGLDDSPAIRAMCRVRPMLSDANLTAFLAQTVRVPNACKWHVQTTNGARSGEVSAAKGQGRVWELRKQPLSEKGAIEIELLGGQKLRFSEIGLPPNDVQNAFLLDGGNNAVTLFFAFFDGAPERYQPAWRTARYTMEIVKP